MAVVSMKNCLLSTLVVVAVAFYLLIVTIIGSQEGGVVLFDDGAGHAHSQQQRDISSHSQLSQLVEKFSSDLDRLLSLFPEVTNNKVPDCVIHQALKVRHLLVTRKCLLDDDFEHPLSKSVEEEFEHEEELDRHQKAVIKMLMRKSHLTLDEQAVLDEVDKIHPKLLQSLLEEMREEAADGFGVMDDDEDSEQEDQDGDGESGDAVIEVAGEFPERNWIAEKKQRAPTSGLAGEGLPSFPRKLRVPRPNEAVFVAVVNYRDPQCVENLLDAFSHAEDPSRIYFGIAQQNNPHDLDCFNVYCERAGKECRSDQVRVLRLKAGDAKGVMYARYLAASLWSGEMFFLQIDAHSGWSKNWDRVAIDQWKQLDDDRAVLSHHPPDMALYPKGMHGRSIDICKYTWDPNRLPRFSSIMTNEIDKPYPGIFIGAGAVFGRAEFIVDCPFDHHLHYLFSGEELLLSVCLFTKGWNLYNPSQMFVWHWYKRDIAGRTNPFNAALRDQAVLRIKYQMQILAKKYVPKKMLKDIEPYLMGDVRTPQEYWKYAGLDWEKRGIVEPFCDVDPESSPKYHHHNTKIKGLPPLASYKLDTIPLPSKEHLANNHNAL